MTGWKMRVVSGDARGRRFESPSGNTRPTSEKVREAMFDILGDVVYESRVLDLYAGSGGLGIEALSRGAKCSTFVDLSRSAVSTIISNLRELGFEDRARVIRADCIKFVRRLSAEKAQFDLIFVDPPYSKGVYRAILEEIGRGGLLSEGGIVVVESHKGESFPGSIGGIELVRERTYGDTKVTFWRRMSVGKAPASEV